MNRDERDGTAVYRFDSLDPTLIDAFVTTRIGGVSKGAYASLNLGLRVKDNAADVATNRQTLFDTFGLPLTRSVWCKQVHADHVQVVAEADAGRGALDEGNIIESTDALVTEVDALPLCVTLADCVPVVIHDPHCRVVALAHAGWGGTVSRIASSTVRTMQAQFGCKTSDLIAAIGPSIGPDEYEIGEDVIGKAKRTFGSRAAEVLQALPNGGISFDLWAANAIDLEKAGLDREQIEIAGVSTATALGEFYSHRVEGQTGRMIAMAALRPTV